MSEQLFINPYNFIPFGKSVDKKRKSRESAYRSEETLLSGWLTVLLETKTPLIIPDGAHPRYWDCMKNQYVENPEPDQKKNLHKEYKFFRVPSETGKQPVIPGSELRGMIRSVYETVTDSCVPFLLDDKPISQRIPAYASLRRRGLLAYEPAVSGSSQREWVLYSTTAKTAEVLVSDGTIQFMDGRRLKEKNGDFVPGKGWLQYNIPVKKDNYHIAYLNPKEVVYRWKLTGDDDPYQQLKTALNGPAQKLKSRNQVPNKNIAEALKRAKNGEGNMVPVYYFIVYRNNKPMVYLSNSSIGRIAQRRKWKEIMGIHAPCEDTDRLCPACLMFGTTSGKGMKGHVRFTDGTPVGELKSEVHTLQILGEPRPSAFEFYLRKPDQPNVTYWNFDFYGKKTGFSKRNDNYTEYHDLDQATPRGRKIYWHHALAADAAKGNMNSTMEAMNGSFEFRVYFDEITEGQLRDLIWVITLGENRNNSTKQHKLGHGKPLGYGSVKLTVQQKAIRKLITDGNSMEVQLDLTDYENIQPEQGDSLDREAVKTLLHMCDTQSFRKNIPVMYPLARNKNGDFIYQWFSNNRKNPGTLKTLPEPLDEDLVLRGSWNEPNIVKEGHKRSDYHKEDDQRRIVGKVKFFKADQNFGYITVQGDKDYKVGIHATYNPDLCEEDLKPGTEISFVPRNVNGKWMANQCRKK